MNTCNHQSNCAGSVQIDHAIVSMRPTRVHGTRPRQVSVIPVQEFEDSDQVQSRCSLARQAPAVLRTKTSAMDLVPISCDSIWMPDQEDRF